MKLKVAMIAGFLLSNLAHGQEVAGGIVYDVL